MLLLIVLSYVSISPPSLLGGLESLDKVLQVLCLIRQGDLGETAASHGARTLPEKSTRHPAKETYDSWSMCIYGGGWAMGCCFPGSFWI